MLFDIFFSISQCPVAGDLPDERRMFRNFFDQVGAADTLGYGVAWIAESHLSSQVQKGNRQPVIPHWQGEVGLNADFCQLAHHVLRRTSRIEVGSAVMNIVCMGGPVTHAERVAVALALHGLDPEERRRFHIGFAAGRFEFMNRATGVVPRDAFEDAAWPLVKGAIFREATEVFCRLLRGDVISSDDVELTTLTAKSFRGPEEWERVRRTAADLRGLPALPEAVVVDRRWTFEALKIIPQEFRRDLLQLVIGSHDPEVQHFANRFMPAQVFNLSITRPEIIEETHRRMATAYHPMGGPWSRGHMPRTVMVFLNEEAHLGPEARKRAAREEAREALAAYWTALEGTLDPKKVEQASENAVIGDAAEVAQALAARFHPDDRVMLWFDFFNHDNARVIRNMEAFRHTVVPLLQASRRSR